MMYLSSIHNKSVGVKENDYIQQHNSFVNAIFEEMESVLTNANELIEFNIFTEDAEQSLGNKITNGLRKIGEKIIEMLRRIKEFISDAINKIKADIWNSKSDEQKLRDFMRKYPDKAKDLKMAVSRGELAFPSYRDLSDFYKNIDQILLDIQRGRIDPKSIRGRWEAVKAKINDNERLIKNTSVALGIIGTGATLYITANKFIMSRNEHLREAGNAEKGFELMKKNAEVAIKVLERRSADVKSGNLKDNMTSTQVINDMIAECNKLTSGSFGKWAKLDARQLREFANSAKTTEGKMNAIKEGLNKSLQAGNEIFGDEVKAAKSAAAEYAKEKALDALRNPGKTP